MKSRNKRTRYINHGGYVMILAHDHPRADAKGFVPEHWIVAEMNLGRFLIPPEEVHHINLDKQDNRPENLQVFPNHSEHRKLHIQFIPKRYCKLCNRPHFGLGFCVKHYNRHRESLAYNRTPCDKCGKTIRKRAYLPKDGLRLCQRCRYPIKTCKRCHGARARLLGFCYSCYQKTQESRWKIPCSKCGKKIRKTGRNQFPAVCWTCRFPKRTCRICGGKHEGLGLCENHYKQWKRGTLLANCV